MKVNFKNNKLKKECENPAIAQKQYGINMKYKLTLRVNELRAAKDLSDIAKNARVNGFHELKGDRKKEYAVTLVEPYRLVFTTDEESIKETTYINIKCIKIEEVVDYHGKSKRK